MLAVALSPLACACCALRSCSLCCPRNTPTLCLSRMFSNRIRSVYSSGLKLPSLLLRIVKSLSLSLSSVLSLLVEPLVTTLIFGKLPSTCSTISALDTLGCVASQSCSPVASASLFADLGALDFNHDDHCGPGIVSILCPETVLFNVDVNGTLLTSLIDSPTGNPSVSFASLPTAPGPNSIAAVSSMGVSSSVINPRDFISLIRFSEPIGFTASKYLPYWSVFGAMLSLCNISLVGLGLL